MKASWEHHLGADVGARIARQHSLNDPELVRSLIQEAGYRDIAVETEMGVVRLPSSGHLARSYGAMAGLSAAEPARTRIIEEVETALQPYNGANGLEFPIEAVLAKAQK
jgi:hypothetical protein